MTDIKRMARNICKSLAISICEYQHKTGASPTKIFAELDAYLALQVHVPVYLFGKNVTVCGIPVEPIEKPGLGIYLCGDPVPLRDIPDGDLKVIFDDGTEKEVQYGL